MTDRRRFIARVSGAMAAVAAGAMSGVRNVAAGAYQQFVAP
jgi:hypothetical protein